MSIAPNKSAAANSRRAFRLRVAGNLCITPALHRRSPAAVAELGRSAASTHHTNMNRYRYTVVALTVLALSACLWFAIHATAQDKPGQTAPPGRGNDQYQRMLDEQEARFKRTDALMQAQEETHKQVVALYSKMEELVKRQEEDIKRYERILETWEKQQQQYQKYLDSLVKK